MRRLLIIGVVLLVAVAILLSSVSTPFLSFRRYACHLPVVFTHSHIQSSLASIRDAGLASLCLSPLLVRLPSFCSWRENTFSNVTLMDLTLIQDRMGEQLAQHDLTDSFNTALFVQCASDIALAFDDLALLFEDGNLELHGIGHVRLLVEVNRASRSLWAALYRVTLHIELGLSRLAYIDKTVLAGLKPSIRSSDRRHRISVAPLLLSHLVHISSSATLGSINHIQAEIATAEAAFSILLEALREFMKDHRVQRQCALPKVKNVCADISDLWSGEGRLRTVRNDLAKVTQILDAAVRGLSIVATGTNAAQSAVTETFTGIDPRKLEESMRKLFRSSWFAQQARMMASTVLKVARSPVRDGKDELVVMYKVDDMV